MTTASSDTELLTEHFGYPPVSLLDEIINSINFIAERALASVEQGLLNAPPQQIGFGRPPALSKANSKSKRKDKKQQQQPPEEDEPDLTPEEVERRAHDEISNGTHQLETLLCASIDRNFDKFELYVMRNILCVRPEDRDWMRLGHYDGLSFDRLPPTAPRRQRRQQHDGGEENGGADKMDVDVDVDVDVDGGAPDMPTLQSVNQLRRRLHASQKLNTMLHAEKARNDVLLGELRSLVGRATTTTTTTTGQQQKPPFAFLHERGDLTQADASTPLSTTTAFSLSQLQALRALSTSLSNITPSLRREEEGDAGGAGAEGGAGGGVVSRRTWRKERVEYVEGAARRHLEIVRGLELGENGEVRDGEWQGEGRRFASGEVAALEEVVGALARSAGDQESGGGGGDGGREDKDEEMAG